MPPFTPVRADLGEVARALDLAARMPNPRPKPRADDLKGNFDLWFDGGAMSDKTGARTIRLADGTVVRLLTTLGLSAVVELPGGVRVVVKQEPESSKPSR